MAKVTVVPGEQALAEAAAERLTAIVEQAVAHHGAATVSLTGGSTPRRLYALLADATRPWRDRIEWARLHLFWGDERHVPPDHADSNYGMARAALLDHVPVPAAHVHRMRGEMADAAEAARAYEQELHDGFAAAGRSDLTFDLMLLGLGEDAHIASIFPGSSLLRTFGSFGPFDAFDPLTPRTIERSERLGRFDRVAAVWAAHLNAWRITLTPPAILDSRAIVMVVSGSNKAAAVAAAVEGAEDVMRRPAQLLRAADDRVEWFLDRAASDG
jgi:6-phosphogluconolactonase